MGSTRLPAKVIADVCGHPIIWHIADRLRHARKLAGSIVATSAGNDCNPIRDIASRYGLRCFSGSEDDLIQRLLGAARQARAEAVVRVTADCPFVDPALIDEMIAMLDERGTSIDCVVNYVPRRFPHGLDLEVYPVKLLERLDREVTATHDREWFPTYVSTRPDAFRLASLTCPEDLSALRWTVDYPEDLAFCRAVYERLWRPDGIFGMNDMLDLLAREPALGEVNGMHATHSAPSAPPEGQA
jgi:spore coat polysaccharide biosynthesis protein SpsF (cytidylyltransferase family)